MKEIKIKRYNNIEEMNYNYNVLIYYKNKVNMSSDIFKSLDSLKCYIELVLEMDDYIPFKEIRRSYTIYQQMIFNKYKKEQCEEPSYIIKALINNIMINYIKM